MKVYDLKETLTLMKSALHELDTHAADIETVREALNDYRKVEPSGQLLGRLHKALAALDRLEGR